MSLSTSPRGHAIYFSNLIMDVKQVIVLVKGL